MFFLSPAHTLRSGDWDGPQTSENLQLRHLLAQNIYNSRKPWKCIIFQLKICETEDFFYFICNILQKYISFKKKKVNKSNHPLCKHQYQTTKHIKTTKMTVVKVEKILIYSFYKSYISINESVASFVVILWEQYKPWCRFLLEIKLIFDFLFFFYYTAPIIFYKGVNKKTWVSMKTFY